MTQRPCSVAEALTRMRAMVGVDVPYQLGPRDCAGTVCEAYKLTRHRPGYARGPLPAGWERFADVVDDINTSSMIKDALIRRELFRFLASNEPLEEGDLLAYPTIRLTDAQMQRHEWIGHVQMVEHGNGATAGGPYSMVQIIHCHGPNGRRPAVTRGNAHVMDLHNERWQKPWSKAWALRTVP